jgi:nucleotide-binding universal stress UspA family protein
MKSIKTDVAIVGEGTESPANKVLSMKFSLSKILLPLDFSEKAVEGARYAIQLAEAFGASITLLHVLTQHYGFDMPGFENGVLTDFFSENENKARETLDGFLKREFRHLKVKRVRVKGDPAQEIVRYAHSERFNLIIMPTHGHGPFRRRLLGSVTAKVLHDVNIPVLTGVHIEKSESAKLKPLRRILCAVDLGPDSARTLRWASGLASRFDSLVTAVHVVASFDFPGEGYGPPGWTRLAKEKPMKAVANLLRNCAVDAQIHLEAGDVPEALCSAATKLRASLLVIGRGSLTGDGGRLSTNAYAIIRKSPCAVVSV